MGFRHGIIYDGEQPRLEYGRPAGRLFLLPKGQVDVLDVWYTGGLRGTGSTDWEVSDFFVPEQDACQAFTGRSTTHTAPFYRMPGTYFGMGLCSVALEHFPFALAYGNALDLCFGEQLCPIK